MSQKKSKELERIHIVVSHFIDVGVFSSDKFIEIFQDLGIVIAPKTEAGRFYPLKKQINDNIRDFINSYLSLIGQIFSPRLAVAKRFLCAVLKEEKFRVRSVTIENKKFNVTDSTMFIKLFSNGVIEFSMHLYLEIDSDSLSQCTNSPSILLTKTDLELDVLKYLNKYIEKILLFERNAGREPKKSIWNIFMSLTYLVEEQYLQRIPSNFKELANLLRTPAMDDYFIFILPQRHRPLLKVDKEEKEPYYVTGDTLYLFPDEVNKEVFLKFLRYIITFRMVNYIVSSVKFIIGTLLKPLKYYKDMDDFVRLTDIVSRFSSDINSMAFIKLIPENEDLLEFIRYTMRKMYVKTLLEDMNFSMKLLERKLDIISSKANEEALRIFNTLLSGSLAMDIASILRDYIGFGLAEFAVTVASWWIFLFISFWMLQQTLEKRFFRKTLRSTIS
ncbi:MAG: hypothetical protein Q6351_009915 [Candidatus Njordarchaeum guaymaensis]